MAGRLIITVDYLDGSTSRTAVRDIDEVNTAGMLMALSSGKRGIVSVSFTRDDLLGLMEKNHEEEKPDPPAR